MKRIFLVIAIVYSFQTFAQLPERPYKYKSLSLSVLYMPLINGAGIQTKMQFNFLNFLGVQAGVGYGRSTRDEYRLAEEKSTASHFSLGYVIKTPTNKRNARRKLSLWTATSVIYGKTYESARHKLDGVDFDAFTGPLLTQDYNFYYVVLSGGIQYRSNKKWHVELSSHLLRAGEKLNSTPLSFQFKGVPSFASGYGVSLGIGYRFWENIKKK